MPAEPNILILTPVKNAAEYLSGYVGGLQSLTYPRDWISVGLLEGDSDDATYAHVEERLDELRQTFRRVSLFKKDFGYRIPPGVPRWSPGIQKERRSVLAKARNHLLFRALDDEDWVLWLDVDVIEYPPDVIERLLATGKDIVQPNCVYRYGGRSFDTNAWRDHGKLHLHDLKEEGELVPLDSVGGTMLLIRADVHRDGLVFPAFPYGLENPKIRRDNAWLGELETEGLGIMAADAGVQCWGMPNLEILHHS
jgi:glycosyltransferase involved in cell wall biosynthesis